MTAPIAFLAYITEPGPGICMLNLQVERDGEFLRCEISRANQANMLVELAELARKHNQKETA
jgi:hypothetical protein